MATLGDLLNEARRLLRAGQFDGAEAIYRQLLAAVPEVPDIWHEMGLFQLEAGRPTAAVEFMEKSIAMAPDRAAYHGNLGAVYRQLKRPADALACFQRAAQHAQPTPESYSNLGLALRETGQEAEALAAYDNALRLREDYANGHFNRANLLLTMGRIDEAIAGYQRAIELQPGDAEAMYRMGVAYFDKAQLDDALDCWERALAIRPSHAESRRSRALVWLRQGDYQRGWAEWEHRFGCEDLVTRHCPEPRWDGRALAGRRLLLHAEQGLGDTLQFMRYVELVKPLADSFQVEVQPALVPLLSASGYGSLLVPRGTPVECDVQCPLMSLPFTLADHSAPYWGGPYLAPNEHLSSKWKAEVRATDDLQVGIVWSGNPDHPHDRFRSLRLDALAPLAAMPGVRLVSLQKGAAAGQLAELPPGLKVVDLAERLDTSSGAFMDTAAVISNLDLVISVDTSIAHLAGGMGVPVWLLLSFSPDWRWRLEGDETPWYPSMRLFRQSRLHEWSQVLHDVAEQLPTLKANRHA